MDDTEIEFLMNSFKDGIFWKSYDEVKKIIGVFPKWKEKSEETYSPVAFLEGGGYIDLNNVTIDDFYVMIPLKEYF